MSQRKSGTNHFHHVVTFTPAIPDITTANAVGHKMFERPSPNWKARTATWRLMPKRSASGAMIGILVAAWPEPDGIRKLSSVWNTSINSAESIFGK